PTPPHLHLHDALPIATRPPSRETLNGIAPYAVGSVTTSRASRVRRHSDHRTPIVVVSSKSTRERSSIRSGAPSVVTTTPGRPRLDRKSTRLNSSHEWI